MIRHVRFLCVVAAAHLLCLLSPAQLEPNLLDRASTGDATAMHLIGRAAAAAGKPVEAYAWFSLAAEYGVETAEKTELFNKLNAAQVDEAAQRVEVIRSKDLHGLPPPSPKSAARIVIARPPVAEKPVAPPPAVPATSAVTQPALDGMVEAQKAQNARLEADLAAARTEVSDARKQSEERTAQLDSALAKAGQERDALTGEIATLKKDKQRAEESLAQMRAQPSLEGQVQSQKAQIAKLETALAQASKERDALSGEIAALKKDKQGAEESLAQLKARPSLEGHVQEQKAQIAKLEASLTTLRQERQGAEEARDQLRVELSAVRSKQETDLAAARAEASAAKAKAGEAAKLEAAVAQASKERDALSGEVAALKKDKQRAEESLAQMRAQPSLEGQVQSQKAQIAKLEADIAASRSETLSARAQSEESIARLEAALAEAGKGRDALSSEVAALKRDKQRAEESLAQMRAQPSLEGQVQAQRAQIAKLETDLAAARSETQAAKARAEESAARLAAASAKPSEDQDSHAKEIASLRQERLSAEQARDRMRAELATTRTKLEADLAAARLETRTAKAQIAKLEAELAAARAEARSGNTQFGESTAQLQEALAQASRDLAAEQIRNGNLVRELARARSDALLASDGTGTLRAVPSRSPAPEPVGAPAPAATAAREHTVASGESLSSISLRYYGTPNRWREIFEANRDVMKSENQLAPGMKLRIP